MDRRMELLDRIAESNLSLGRYPRSVRLIIDSYRLELRVWKGVFDPSLGFTSRYLIKSLIEKQYKFKKAFDMGCGCGAIGMAMIENQIADKVDAFEIHPLAVRNARWNISRNVKVRGKVKVYSSDFFVPIGHLPLTGQIYDGGVFNHPYLPDSLAQKKWQKRGVTGGAESIRNFLTQARAYMLPGSPIIMPYSDVVDAEHSPARIGKELELKVTKIAEYPDGKGKHLIFEICI